MNDILLVFGMFGNDFDRLLPETARITTILCDCQNVRLLKKNKRYKLHKTALFYRNSQQAKSHFFVVKAGTFARKIRAKKEYYILQTIDV